MATTWFLSPAANAVDTTHQHAVGPANLFDIELARPWGWQRHRQAHGVVATEMPVFRATSPTITTKIAQTKKCPLIVSLSSVLVLRKFKKTHGVGRFGLLPEIPIKLHESSTA
ncbi:hypothetical protein N7471_010378 [Penicillium samsonianum]|uniref:uncharacterized protein n=1 Tax=Penicillium samsonianum TaxID=1882272 RepID=UPI0025487642|nr:uncharacterized protein N7471_010378 [Penicillium samsonianum]KAJ6125885.1 hypothetical protein N7471_010378 [Penicillium samsonianum]